MSMHAYPGSLRRKKFLQKFSIETSKDDNWTPSKMTSTFAKNRSVLRTLWMRRNHPRISNKKTQSNSWFDWIFKDVSESNRFSWQIRRIETLPKNRDDHEVPECLGIIKRDLVYHSKIQERDRRCQFCWRSTNQIHEVTNTALAIIEDKSTAILSQNIYDSPEYRTSHLLEIVPYLLCLPGGWFLSKYCRMF